LATEVERKENDPDYVPHEPLDLTPEFSPEVFEKLIGRPLPPKTVVRKRPYSLNATLGDLKRTFIGRILARMVKKEALKMSGDSSPVAREMILKSLMETPVRTLAVMSGGKVKLETMELLVRLINFGRLGQ
jgi:beta-glucosidase